MWGAIVLAVALVLPTGDWAPLRNDAGQRLTWHSCTVTYSGPTSKPLRRAMRLTERASGVRFKRVPRRRADLHIRVRHRAHPGDPGRYADLVRWVQGRHHTHAHLTVYPRTLRLSARTARDIHRHELGHALGLAHVRGNDLMSPYLRPNQTARGWRRGLRTLYRHCR